MEQNSNQRVKTSVVSIMLIEEIGEAVSEASASSHTAGATFPFKRFGTAAAAYYLPAAARSPLCKSKREP